ncbi:MAG: glycosyltransferase family 1 protein [Burkholderiaceae bacterium]|nr:glycosyltransferase family 1 protein [Burkholderiaceae bacterium]
MNAMTDLPARVDVLSAVRQPLSVAVVTETYPPEVNGVAVTLQRMLEGLKERQHRIQLVRLRQHTGDVPLRGVRFNEALMRGVPIPRYPSLRMGVPCSGALQRLWSEQRPDVVHIATEGPLGWSALRAAHRLQLPVVSDFRTNFHAYSRHYGLAWLQRPIVGYLRGFHNRTACTMVPTQAMRRQLEDLGFANLEVVSRGVDTVRFHPGRRHAALRARWGADDDTLVVLCVSRLAQEKNIELLCRAFDAISAGGIKARLVLVGDGPLRATLQRRWPEALLAGVRRGDDLAAHYASADLFLFPSLTETFGNVVPEAMASGLPVVAFDCAAAAQLVSPDSGVLVPPPDAPAFIEQALHVARDRRSLRVRGQHARGRAALLDWRHVIDDLEAVLLHAVLRHAANQSPLLLRPSAI